MYNLDPGKRKKDFGRYVSPQSVYNVVKTRLKRQARALTTWEIGGIDISKWNGTMEWAVTMPLVDFLYLRGGYGNFRDPRFDEYRAACLEHNKPFGVYWFVYVGLEIYSQVDAFLDVLGKGGWVLPPVADFEWTSLSPVETTAWIKRFMEELKARMSAKPMIYTSPGWWNKNVLANAWAKDYYLWVAHWTSADQPILPHSFTSALFWQWSADGNGEGRRYGSIDGDHDMDKNWFFGDLAAWRALIGGSDQEPEEKPSIAFEVFVNDLLKRSGPWTTYARRGARKTGEVVEIADYNLWIRDKDGNWSAVRHLGKEYMKKITQ
jgi:GH25 family lysozyme M1 (1,4-beta-N-acetylmuramidase)